MSQLHWNNSSCDDPASLSITQPPTALMTSNEHSGTADTHTGSYFWTSAIILNGYDYMSLTQFSRKATQANL